MDLVDKSTPRAAHLLGLPHSRSNVILSSLVSRLDAISSAGISHRLFWCSAGHSRAVLADLSSFCYRGIVSLECGILTKVETRVTKFTARSHTGMEQASRLDAHAEAVMWTSTPPRCHGDLGANAGGSALHSIKHWNACKPTSELIVMIPKARYARLRETDETKVWRPRSCKVRCPGNEQSLVIWSRLLAIVYSFTYQPIH